MLLSWLLMSAEEGALGSPSLGFTEDCAAILNKNGIRLATLPFDLASTPLNQVDKPCANKGCTSPDFNESGSAP
jgi:hypothetical protein